MALTVDLVCGTIRAQQLQQHPQLQRRPVLFRSQNSSHRLDTVCQASRRSVQDLDKQQQSSSTVISSNPQVSISVPIEPSTAAPAQQQSHSNYGVVVFLAAVALAAGLVFKKLKSSGYDPFARDYMQSVNAMQMDELDPEIIAAARARRSRERANHRLDLDDIELPDNHPWATRKPLTPEQEAAIQARLQVRPRRAASGEARPGRARQLGRD